MTWKPDLRHERTVGDFTVVPERRDGETAHRVTAQDGRELRILPDPDVSGQRRSRTILDALAGLGDLVWRECQHDELDHSEADPFLFLIGRLAEEGMTWEWVGRPRAETLEDWLAVTLTRLEIPGWFERDLHRRLANGLKLDGWKIKRAE